MGTILIVDDDIEREKSRASNSAGFYSPLRPARKDTSIGEVPAEPISVKQSPSNSTSLPPFSSKWANRFIWAATIQGLAATLLTIIIVLPNITPAASKEIVVGGAGTGFLVG